MFSSILEFYPAVSLQLPCSVLTTKKMSPDITKFPLKAKSPQLKTTAIKERQPSQFYSGEREVKVLVAQPHARFLCPWNSLGKKTGVGSHSLLQEIFPTQGSNLDLPHGGQILYHLSHQGRSTVFQGYKLRRKEDGLQSYTDWNQDYHSIAAQPSENQLN